MMHTSGLLSLLLLGLGGGEPVDPSDAAGGLEVAIQYPRYLQVDGERVTVAITNTGDELLHVEHLAIRSPAFEQLAPEDKDYTIRPGHRADLPVELGAVRCDHDPAESAVELALSHGDPRWEGLVAVDDTRLRLIWDDRCADLAITKTVDIGFGEQFEVVDDRLQTTLAAELLDPGGWARVDAMRGSVILTVSFDTPADSPLAAVDGERPAAAFPVTISPSRCESHAVIESKKTFDFGVWVTTAEHEAEHIVVRPTGALLAELEAMIRECIERHATGD